MTKEERADRIVEMMREDRNIRFGQIKLSDDSAEKLTKILKKSRGDFRERRPTDYDYYGDVE